MLNDILFFVYFYLVFVRYAFESIHVFLPGVGEGGIGREGFPPRVAGGGGEGRQ